MCVDPSNVLHPHSCPIPPLNAFFRSLAFEAAHHVIFTNLKIMWPGELRNGYRKCGEIGIYPLVICYMAMDIMDFLNILLIGKSAGLLACLVDLACPQL